MTDAELLIGLPDGASFLEGRGPLGSGKWGIEINGRIFANLHPTKELAVAEAKQWVANRLEAQKAAAERKAKLAKLRAKLEAGEEATAAELKLLNLREGSSGLKWFIPAAAELFGITNRQVRPLIKELIKTGYSDFGAKYESVNAQKALAEMALALKGMGT